MIKIFDNEGKTIDRYSLVLKAPNGWDVYSFSPNALSPLGVNQFGGTHKAINLSSGEKEIEWDNLPFEVQRAICARLLAGIPEEKPKLRLADCYNMENPRGNRPVPNQFIITTEDGSYFKSYQSIIAFIPKGNTGAKIVLDENKWDYSTTTGKYRNQFLAEGIEETRKKIKSGEYILADLNPR